ncbi:PLP-dependent aminotransferase family protein [Brucella gallinifaecis]|uniref:aminotransferase-like domain-containing protein n=1 Tax=Brucella gallinifaecis TaxID=215590 RepID=UPI00236268F9|nr:PLP-dependent aminotransferase family protein [Brucella gallinifaecis]
MTNWLPDLTGKSGPLYLQLADAIEDAITTGALPAGEKLPPQRNLAFDLKVTIGTIGRAYALAHERGLVTGEVGRGTYVLGKADRKDAPIAYSSDGIAGTRIQDAPADKGRFDTTAAPDVGQNAILEPLIASIIRNYPHEVVNYTRYFPQHWLEAGRQWLNQENGPDDASNIVITNGAHAGAVAAITAFTSPGDRIVFEELTYTQISRSVKIAGRRVAIAASDEYGMIPEEFERVCNQQHPTMAFLMPSIHNPTLATMPYERRVAIANIAARHNVWLIEDDTYGVMTRSNIPKIADIAPERTFLLGSLSKAVTAGLRCGWAACPPHCAQRLRVTHKLMTGGVSFLLAETTAQMVLSGQASALLDRCSAEIEWREQLARKIFAGHDFVSSPHVPILWLKLPEPWHASTFKAAAYENGLLIDDEDEFKAGRIERNYHRVRIAFSSPTDRSHIENGFITLRQLLENEQVGYEGSF